jgi:peptidoglycan hydrolase-like protein with peptidoglycan-binding domain
VIAVGATVNLGDVLYTVDSHPVVALSGQLPAWRSLSTSSSDGPDVEQLERSLTSLGYDPTGTVTVDQHFDAKTRAMVERWQTGLGVEATGTVALGSVVFLPTAATVNSVTAKVGDAVSDGDVIVTLAAATQEVVVDVPAADQAVVTPGLQVTIGSGTGTVSLLRSADRNGTVAVEAVITPSAPIQNASNGATVKVTVKVNGASGVLLVPATALVSKLDGTYAVEVRHSDGTDAWVTVEMLGVSGTNVGVRGDGITQGTTVLVPR